MLMTSAAAVAAISSTSSTAFAITGKAPVESVALATRFTVT